MSLGWHFPAPLIRCTDYDVSLGWNFPGSFQCTWVKLSAILGWTKLALVLLRGNLPLSYTSMAQINFVSLLVNIVVSISACQRFPGKDLCAQVNKKFFIPSAYPRRVTLKCPHTFSQGGRIGLRPYGIVPSPLIVLKKCWRRELLPCVNVWWFDVETSIHTHMLFIPGFPG